MPGLTMTDVSIASTLIGNQTETCLNVQKSAAKKLQSLSDLIRKQQKDANIAKATCVSAGAAGTLMSVVGAVVTGGMSVLPMVAGATVGIIGGAGEMVVSWLESEEMAKRIAEVQDILDQLKEETESLIDVLRRKSKYTDVPDYETLIENKMKLDCARKCGKRARKAITVVNRTLQVKWMATGLKPEDAGVHNIAKIGRGVAYLRRAKAGKVIKSAGVAAAGISFAFDIKDLLKNLNDVKNSVSEVADVVANMANVLGAAE